MLNNHRKRVIIETNFNEDGNILHTFEDGRKIIYDGWGTMTFEGFEGPLEVKYDPNLKL